MRIERIALVALALALLGATVAHAGRAPAHIKGVEIVKADPGTARYSGKVKSPRSRCERNRKVTVVRDSAPPSVIGDATTDAGGKWALSGPLPPSGHRIIVKVKPKPGCSGASRTYEVVYAV
jgi:hypothetical protein